jgi:glycosyltransferase involved in cell wall biosynthesis
MRLTVDLRFDAVSRPPVDPAERHLSLHDLLGAAKRPRHLMNMIRPERYEDVTVIEDGRPLSGLQAAALVAVGLARARTFRVDDPGGSRATGRGAFLARALARAASAVPRELWSTVRLSRVAKRAAEQRFDLPGAVSAPRSVLYLRTEPTLRWEGTYVGGSATHTTGVITGFMANGLDVRVLAAERPAGIDGAAFSEVSVGRPYQLVRGLSYTAYGERVVHAGRGLQADFVYQRYTLGSSAGLELAERAGVPLVLEFNGSDVWVEEQWNSGRLRLARTLSALERRNLMDASLVVVVSDVLREAVVEHGVPDERLLVNPNGVDVDRLAPLRERSASEWRSAGGRPEAPTVGFIGTFGPWHGVRLLPDLVEAVAAVRPDARWIVIGGGWLHEEVSEEIERRGLADRVLLTGLIDHDEALRLLAASDVCVSPHVPNPDGSRFFGSPTKLFEYMGLGKAIVASDLEQIGEVIEDERTGLLSPPGDVDAAAAAILRLLDDPELRVRLGDAALAEARERYSWKAHTRRILDALAARA